jgi:hypothetical protein
MNLRHVALALLAGYMVFSSGSPANAQRPQRPQTPLPQYLARPSHRFSGFGPRSPVGGYTHNFRPGSTYRPWRSPAALATYGIIRPLKGFERADVGSASGRVGPQRRATRARPTGTGSTYMNYSHYYPSASRR